MSDLSHEARALIEAARPAERPPGAAKAKVHAALATRLALPPGAPHQVGRAASSTGVMGTGRAMLALVGALATVVGVVAISAARHRGPSVTKPAARVQPSPVSVALPETVRMQARPLPQPSATPGPKIPTSPQPGRDHMRADDLRVGDMEPTVQLPGLAHELPPRQGRHSSGMAPADTHVQPHGLQAPDNDTDLPVARHSSDTPPSAWTGCTTQEELRLLIDVQTALRDRRGAEALALLEHHAAACPRTRFSEEHSAAHILALCLARRRDEALREAARLALETPKSPQLARLRSSCAAAALSGSLPAQDHSKR
jgi:hypothetical protein